MAEASTGEAPGVNTGGRALASGGVTAESTAGTVPSRWARWQYVLTTTNPPVGAELDPVSRWLVVSRAAVLPMTLVSGMVAGLLAVRQPDFHSGWFLLALGGIVLAHVSNNLMNDLFDSDVGLDTADYPRALYAPHPVLAGLISRRGLAGAALAVNAADLMILAVLWDARGWPVAAFALSGFVLSVAYTAPPLRLKKRGLGEADVFVVWGPLMVGGTFYAAAGHLPWEVMLASVPYGVLATSVLMAKHIDKAPWDASAGVRTLPVMVGEKLALRVTQWMMIAFYGWTLGAVLLGALPWPGLLAFTGIPVLGRCSRALGRPRPTAKPDRWPIWPLWYAAYAFLHARRAGALLVAGLTIAAVINIDPYGF